MPYKDPEKQKAAKHAWYLKNKELTRERTKKNKRKYREEIARRVSGGCQICGRTENLSYFWLDDERPNGMVYDKAHNNNYLRKDKADEWIHKLGVACPYCMPTAKQLKRRLFNHGTDKMYNLGCRCLACHAHRKHRWNVERENKQKKTEAKLTQCVK